MDDVKIGRAAATPREMQMAMKLIDELSESFRPERYHDTYHDDLMKRIEEKVAAGQSKTLTRAESRRKSAAGGGKVVDLVALLRKSVDESRDGAHRKSAPSANDAAAQSSGTGRSRYARRRASRTRGRVARRA
jgi:DNA end-binding protein Ku